MSRFFRQAADSDSESESSEEEELMSGSEDDAKVAKPQTAKIGMARFLKTAGASDSSSSESDSDEDEDDSDEDDDEDDDDLPKGSKKKGRGDDSEDEDTKVVVKSAKDKRQDEMEALGKSIDNALRINDWTAVQNEYDKLARTVERQANVAERVSSFYIRTLVNLESSLNTAMAKEKEAKKKMNALNARALNTMKQKIKKASKEYEKEIKLLKEDPEAFEKEFAIPEPVAVPQPSRPRKANIVGDDGEDGASGEDDFQTVGRGGKALLFTSEKILEALDTIQKTRGKKNTDKAEQLKTLEKLLEVAATTYQRIRVLLALIAARFDYNPSISSHMSTDLWLAAQKEVDQLIHVLATNQRYSVQEITPDYKEDEERSPETEEGDVVRIRGSVISFVDRLDDEFSKSLQHIDPHGTEYVERLRDEKGLYQTICLAQGLYEVTKQNEQLARIVMRRLEHIYSKPDAVIQALEGETPSSSPPSITLANQGSTTSLIRALCTHLYKSNNTVLKFRAVLCQSYHHALHNDFHTSRDILLMSHLQDMIHRADVATQILYNRAVVQIGLCAFRVGLIKEAQTTLQDICNTQRVKELLAQGSVHQRFQAATPESEKAERQKLPFHMHINTELIEGAFLVSSMLLEVPLLASIDSEEQKRKVVSKPFRRLLDAADRQVFTGPPESTRDHIMQASKALQEGDWERCRDLIQSIKVWSLMPEAASVKDMLASRIQEEALRTYLFTYGPHYTTLSLSMLAQTFSLPVKSVNSVVSKMIWNEELAASLDQSAGVVVFHHVEMTRLQQLAQTLAERVNSMVEQNEKTLDQKQGSSAWAERAEGARGGRKEGEQTQERKGRSERTRGGAARGTRGGRGSRFAQGLGNRMPASVRA